MGNDTDACARAVRRSCVVFVLQMSISVAFVLVSLWAASLLLELTPIVGITTVPPGIAFVAYDKRH
tara:strand:+ start:103 stop:300 length:198 start_codon:yes stop_codon:yes gene_type:complete